MQKLIVVLLLCSCFTGNVFCQPELPVYYKGAIKERKVALKKNILQNAITNNLSLALNDETEENWTDAFAAMELIHYSSPWTDTKITSAVEMMGKRSVYFQRALLELLYTNYPDRFLKDVNTLMETTGNAKVYAMCGEYLLANKISQLTLNKLEQKRSLLVKNDKDQAIINQLAYRIKNSSPKNTLASLKEFFNPAFLQHYPVVYSVQRKNRNYPGIVIVRDSTGRFVTDETGNVFSVPQLARSINNLPGYLTNGNTPQGIFRMYGFDTSKSNFIGPTTNIQLTMPFETSLKHFFNDSTITDTVWTVDWYNKLLPAKLKNTPSMLESFYAGKAGRTEIIAHGTTVDPEYYKDNSYYPQTPTMGCLCTMELWSDEDGKRMYSDQARLAKAVFNAGGANGYLVVIEIDDAQQPVTLAELLPFIEMN